MKRVIPILLTVIVSAAVFAAVGKTTAQEPATPSAIVNHDQWEYLVVAGANNNLSPSGNSSLRKESAAAFSREAFVLQQSLDKIGAKGWELVSVSGSPGDPVYYFKRRK